MIYLPPDLMEDLRAGSFRFDQPMTVIVEGLVAKWAEENRAALNETRRVLGDARGRSTT